MVSMLMVTLVTHSIQPLLVWSEMVTIGKPYIVDKLSIGYYGNTTEINELEMTSCTLLGVSNRQGNKADILGHITTWG